MNKRMVFKATVLHCTAALSWGQPEIDFGMNHAPGARLIAPPVDLQFCVLPLNITAAMHYHML